MRGFRFNAATSAALGLTPLSPADAQGGPEHQQLDFWVGRWIVQDRGKPIGKGHIEKSSGGCIVHESCVQGVHSGRSLNFFDPVLRRWRQIGVDAGGNVSAFSGEYREGAMRFEGESHLAGSGRLLRRMTLFNLAGGDVRQFSESSTDGGTTWTVSHDFRYVPDR